MVPKKVPTLTVCRKCKHPVNLNGGFPPHPSICTLRPSHPVDITFSFIQAFMRKKYCFFFYKTKVLLDHTLFRRHIPQPLPFLGQGDEHFCPSVSVGIIFKHSLPLIFLKYFCVRRRMTWAGLVHSVLETGYFAFDS